MSEEQGKPKRGLGELRLIVLFTVSLLVIFTLWFLYMAYSNQPGPGKSHIWFASKDEIKSAVVAYQSDHNGLLPTLNDTYTNAECSNCSVINISALLPANGGRILRDVPDSCNLSSTGNDNCGGNASLGCSTDASYIWIVDTKGNVFSYCAGSECATNNSGYQDVYP